MERVLMQLLVQTLRKSPKDKLGALLAEHASVASHCPACRTVWPCTLWSAAAEAQQRGRIAS